MLKKLPCRCMLTNGECSLSKVNNKGPDADKENMKVLAVATVLPHGQFYIPYQKRHA